MPPATFAISTKDDDGINAANNAGSVTAARLVRRFMWNCPEMIPVSEKASTKNDVSRASRINRSAQTPATGPRALRSPTPAISVTSSDAAMVDTQISRQTIRLAKSPPKMALFIRQASLRIPRASSGTANSAVSENMSILLTAIALVFYLLSFIMSIQVLKTEKKAQQRAYDIMKENGMATDEELAVCKKLFRLYNIEYINNMVISLLELVYRVLQIIAYVQNASSSSSRS